MTDGFGLLTFIVRANDIRSVETFCESLKHIMMAVSWGGHESLIIPKCSSMKRDEFDPSETEHRMIRLYCGLEDPEYIIDDLRQALQKI